MPVIKVGKTPQAPNPHVPYSAELMDVGYKHSIVDSSRTPKSALLTHIEGSSWTVDYYSQVLGSDEEPTTFDPNQTQSYQQYALIKGYELKLQGELSTTVDPSDQTVVINGSAMLYPYMKPNFGDAFIADMGDGQAAIFTVTQVEKKSHFKSSVYEIEFTLQRYVDKELDDNITSKVVKTGHFVKDFMTYGQNPVLPTTEKQKLDILTDLKADCLADWLTEFFSVEFKTILVPTEVATYDPFVTQFMVSIFDKSEHPLLTSITLLNIDDQNMRYTISLWDALIKREHYMLRSAFDEYALISPKNLSHNPFVTSSYYSGVSNILVPVSEGRFTDERLGYTGYSKGNTFASNVTQLSDFPLPDFGGDYYVFSKEFYAEDAPTNLSRIEHMVLNYLTHKANDWQEIVKYLENRKHFSRFERFYLIPVLLTLVINEIRSI